MKKKIFKYYLILIAIVLTLTVIFTSQISKKYYKSEVENKLKNIGFSIQYYLLNLSDESMIDYNFIAKDFASNQNQNSSYPDNNLRVTFIDYSGNVLGDSEADYTKMENHSTRKEIQEAIKGSIGKDIRSSTTINSDLLYMTIPVKQLKVIVRVSVPLIQLNIIDRMAWFYSILIILSALILTVFISSRIAESLIRPLNDIVHASKEISNGNYSKRILLTSNDELGQLALQFNEMASKLEKTIFNLNNKKVEVESIVENITYGIVAVDSNNKIILINPAAFDVFNMDKNAKVTSDILSAHIRNNRLNLILKESVEQNSPLESEITFDEKVLLIKTSPIRPKNDSLSNSGWIISIQDITKIRKLEQLRTEFVSNVTHELKTPITSIRGFIETLKSGAINKPDVSERFLDIIDIEAERLHELINDILSLSEIENKLSDTDLESFSLKSIIDGVFEVMENIAIEKNVLLNNTVDEKILIKANRNRMKQLVLNLVDNAIKYNIPTGSVTVDAQRVGGKVVISVKDTGIGIPPDHIPRIFERFYRVDKGRSRDMGGTGLGLSIVKHIVNLYNGDIKVSSEVGKGTEFIIQLPT
ncbi:two-component system histidine kinase PnpS [Acetivibrio cellulolyticus]|uniref:two-component system histidine kinase PnpS n=1 Tax=Acetivibrio cellulolyticus TaxID=35830 RepID=UPI0001E2D8EE|nr:ATP-binding protein [Acetivibrio cellulolyticus]